MVKDDDAKMQRHGQTKLMIEWQNMLLMSFITASLHTIRITVIQWRVHRVTRVFTLLLWPPYVIGQAIIFFLG